MLKAMWSQPPCMNIDVKIVANQGRASRGWGAGIDCGLSYGVPRLAIFGRPFTDDRRFGCGG